MGKDVTNATRRLSWQPTDDYDDRSRWLDDQDGGDRWRNYVACRDTDPALFFPVEVIRQVRQDADGNETVTVVPTDQEPANPPPEVKAICDRCPVRGRCLDKYMNEPVGIYGGMTGFQRELLTKKKKRKRCVACGSSDVVTSGTQKNEICLACGNSWEIL